MKTILAVALTLLLMGCSPVPFAMKYKPAGVTDQQVQVDNLQCHEQSKRSGPWLYGVGTLIYRRMAASSYQECMNKKGYAVEEQ
jgi:starvation-inducible outer membrane lipoprotein